MGLPVLTEEKIALVEGRLNHEWHERGVSCFVAFAPFRDFRVSKMMLEAPNTIRGILEFDVLHVVQGVGGTEIVFPGD